MLAQDHVVRPVQMHIELTNAQVGQYAQCYKGLPPSQPRRFATAFEADTFLCRRLQGAASRGHLSRADLEEVALWKFPGVQTRSLVAENSEIEVREISKVSFSAKTERLRIGVLLALHGVGWPMASTVLHFVFPKCYPIFDVRVMRTVTGLPNPPGCTFERWIQYTKLCRDKAEEYQVTLRNLDRALWTYDYCRNKGHASCG